MVLRANVVAYGLCHPLMSTKKVDALENRIYIH